MKPISIFENRHLRICYWDAEQKLLGPEKMALESKLKMLGDVNFVEIASLDASDFHPCDLLIIAATKIPEDIFPKWLSGIHNRMSSQANIWTPALIMADVGFDVLDNLLIEAVKSNWYFDVINRIEIDSLPVRIANLLRIHDHLHELRRYEEQLKTLQLRADELEQKLEQFTK